MHQQLQHACERSELHLPLLCGSVQLLVYMFVSHLITAGAAFHFPFFLGTSNFANCDALVSGCETDISSNTHKCGSCTTDCSTLPHIQSLSSACSNKKCQNFCADQ